MIIEILVVAPGGKPGAFLMLLYLLQTPVKQVGRTDNPVVQHPAFRQLPLRAERFTDKADAFAHHDRDGVDSQAVNSPAFTSEVSSLPPPTPACHFPVSVHRPFAAVLRSGTPRRSPV